MDSSKENWRGSASETEMSNRHSAARVRGAYIALGQERTQEVKLLFWDPRWKKCEMQKLNVCWAFQNRHYQRTGECCGLQCGVMLKPYLNCLLSMKDDE